MIVEIKKNDSPEDAKKKVDKLIQKSKADKKNFFQQFFGIASFDEDPVVMQRRWRDEW